MVPPALHWYPWQCLMMKQTFLGRVGNVPPNDSFASSSFRVWPHILILIMFSHYIYLFLWTLSLFFFPLTLSFSMSLLCHFHSHLSFSISLLCQSHSHLPLSFSSIHCSVSLPLSVSLSLFLLNFSILYHANVHIIQWVIEAGFSQKISERGKRLINRHALDLNVHA